jgi:hypothetical protein
LIKTSRNKKIPADAGECQEKNSGNQKSKPLYIACIISVVIYINKAPVGVVA